MTNALFRLAFTVAPAFTALTCHYLWVAGSFFNRHAGRRFSRPSTACKFTVSCSFHSPPGVLFTFPSRYFSLSVIQEYLALRGGPRRFTRNYTCSMLLGILFWLLQFSITRLSLSMVRYSNLIHLIVTFNQFVTIPLPLLLSLGFSPFRSPLLRESRFCFLFL